MTQCRPTSKKEDIFLIGFAHDYKIVIIGKTKFWLTPNPDGIERGGGLVTSLVITLIVAASPYGASALAPGTASPQVGQRSVAAARSTTDCGISTSANRGDYRGSACRSALSLQNCNEWQDNFWTTV